MFETILNWIRKQIGDTCTIYAVSNALEKQTGVCVPDEELLDVYSKFKKDNGKGSSMRRLLPYLTSNPIGGYVVSEYECVYNIHDFWRDTNNAKRKRHLLAKLGRFWEAIRNNEYSAICGIYTRKGSPKIRLNDDYEWMPYDTEITGGHYVYILDGIRGARRKFLGFLVENSWGEYFGDRGMFKIKPKDFWKEVETVYLVKFKYAKTKTPKS